MNDQVPAHHSEIPPADQQGNTSQMELAKPDRVGQATSIEQSRAVAEVQAAAVMARQFPRDLTAAINEMRQSCAQYRLAERAFFKFPRGGESVSGETIHLARELARCWGNVIHGARAMIRDDVHGQSEMITYAQDIQTNTKSETVFIVPHKRDKKGGAVTLVGMRDIYENNSNTAARRLRENIFAMLPPWFKEEAKEICMKTLEAGQSGLSLPQRVSKCIEAFESVHIRQEQLEKKVGRISGKWTAMDVAQLGVTFKSIERGEISKEDEFGPDGSITTAADVAKNKPGKKKAAPKEKTPPSEDDPSQGPNGEILDDDNPFPGDR